MNWSSNRQIEECSVTLQYLPFQVSLVFQCTSTLFSFAATYHFLQKHIKKSSIHQNFKFLLTCFFVRSFLHGAVFLVVAGSFFYRVITWSSQKNPETIFVSPVFFNVVHLSYAFVLLLDYCVKILLVFERTLATGKVEQYENNVSKRTKWMYLAFILITPLSLLFLTYRNASFDSPCCFALFAPENAAAWINILLVLSVLFASLAFIFLRFIIYLNTRKLKISRFQLTTRYQISENLECSHLVSTVLLSSLITTIFFGVSMMTLRLGSFSIFQNNKPLFSAVKIAVYPLAISDLIIPIYSGSQMKKTKSAKITSLNIAISTGTNTKQATDAYEKIFKAQWA